MEAVTVIDHPAVASPSFPTEEIPMDDIPKKFHPVLFRLQKAGVDTHLRRQMIAQDEFDRYFRSELIKP